MKKAILQDSKLNRDITKCLDALRKVWRDKKEIIAWDIDNDHLKSFELKVKEISERNKKIVLIPSIDSADWDGLKKIIRGIGFLNFYLPSECFVFRSELLNLEQDYLVVKYPTRWMLEERRDKIRYDSVGRVCLRLPIKGERVKNFKVFDLSERGLSIILPRGESYSFHEGDIIEKATVDLDGTKEVLALEVMNNISVKPYELEKAPYAAKKIGFKFADENKTVKDFLVRLKKELEFKESSL